MHIPLAPLPDNNWSGHDNDADDEYDDYDDDGDVHDIT